MNVSLEQQVSELVDGELDTHHREDLLKSLKKDDRLLKTWSRYHLISDALRSNLPDYIALDIGTRVRQAIEAEPALLAPSFPQSEPTTIPTKQPAAEAARNRLPLAVAASIAAVGIVGISVTNLSTGPGETLATAPLVEPSSTAPATVIARENIAPVTAPLAPGFLAEQSVGGSQWLRVDPTPGQEISNYLLDHSEYSASTGVRGIFPYARVVSYENGPK